MNDWQAQFPILSPYTPTTLFAKADIVLIGLRLDKVMSDRWYDKVTCDRYRVILQILPLWVEKDKIHIPLDEEELWDDTGLQILLEYKLYDPLLTDFVDGQKKWGVEDADGSKFKREKARRLAILEKAFECAHQRFGAVLKEDVRLSDVLRLIDSVSVLGISGMRKVLELKLALAYYFANKDLIGQVKREIEEVEKEVSHAGRNVSGNPSMEEWKTDLYRRMEDRQAFMQQVDRNLALRKISRLKSIHISDDVDLSQISRKADTGYVPDYVELRQALLRRIKHFFGLDK